MVSRGVYIYVARLWIYRALYNLLDCGFTEHFCTTDLTGFTESGGSCISFISYGVFTKSIIISLVEFIEFCEECQFYLCWALPTYYSTYCYLCVSGNGVGFRGVSCITATAGQMGPSSVASYLLKFLISEVLAAFV